MGFLNWEGGIFLNRDDMIIEIDKEVWQGSPPNQREEIHKFLVDDLPLTPQPCYWPNRDHPCHLGWAEVKPASVKLIYVASQTKLTNTQYIVLCNNLVVADCFRQLHVARDELIGTSNNHVIVEPLEITQQIDFNAPPLLVYPSTNIHPSWAKDGKVLAPNDSQETIAPMSPHVVMQPAKAYPKRASEPLLTY
jgi:hypothetical protein